MQAQITEMQTAALYRLTCLLLPQYFLVDVVDVG